MTTVAAELRPWSRRRSWGAVVLLVVVQGGLIWWLGDRSPTIPRRAATHPAVLLAPELPGEVLALNNPTLFAWPGRRGFSGAAGLKIPPMNYLPADWTEPPRWLALPADDLGNPFHRFAPTNLPAPFQIADRSSPRFIPPEFPLPTTSLPAHSSLRVDGELAARHLLSQFELPSWSYTDLLTNSVVQALVDAGGRTISATLLSSSGAKEADQRALNLAKTARFNSLLVSGPDRLLESVAPLCWGQLIFEWHTTPLPATNAPPANP